MKGLGPVWDQGRLTPALFQRWSCNALHVPLENPSESARLAWCDLNVRNSLTGLEKGGAGGAAAGAQLARRKHRILMLQTDSKLLGREPAARKTQSGDGRNRYGEIAWDVPVICNALQHRRNRNFG